MRLTTRYSAPNLPRLYALMDECDLDAVVVSSPVNVRWLTGFGNWLGPAFREYMARVGGSDDLIQRTFVLAPRAGEPVLVVEPSFVLDATEASVGEVRVAGAAALVPGSADSSARAVSPDDPARMLLLRHEWQEDPVKVVAAVAEEHGLGHSRIGVERGALLAHEYLQLESALPGSVFFDCAALLRLSRAVKTPREIELLERVTAIGESAARQTAASSGPTTTPAEMVDRFRLVAAEAGADFDHVAVSLDGLAFSTGGERHLGEGATMFYDYGCMYHGWLSDSGTTLCVGEPVAEALADHDVVRRAVAAGSELLRPGIRGSFVQAAMQAVLAREGITETVPQGHGIGLEIREHPILVAGEGGRLRDDCLDMDADLPLEENMVLNLEATVHFLGQRSVHCEQSFVITADGSRLLTTQFRDAPFVTGVSGISAESNLSIGARHA